MKCLMKPVRTEQSPLSTGWSPGSHIKKRDGMPWREVSVKIDIVKVRTSVACLLPQLEPARLLSVGLRKITGFWVESQDRWGNQTGCKTNYRLSPRTCCSAPSKTSGVAWISAALRKVDYLKLSGVAKLKLKYNLSIGFCFIILSLMVWAV